MPPEAILRELRTLPWLADGFDVVAIKAGAINQNFRIDTQGQRFFLKCFAPHGPSALDRQALFRLQAKLAAYGIAPAPLYLGSERHFVVEQWIEAKVLSQSDLSNRERIGCLARCLARIHDLPIDSPSLDLPHDWQRYLQQLPEVHQQALADVQRLSQRWLQRPKASFCHHDLSMGHISVGLSPIIFDWEYAACSDPAFDLASCALVNGLSKLETECLCRDYAQVRRMSPMQVMADFELMLPVAELTNRLWYLVAQQKWQGQG